MDSQTPLTWQQQIALRGFQNDLEGASTDQLKQIAVQLLKELLRGQNQAKLMLCQILDQGNDSGFSFEKDMKRRLGL